MVKKVGTLLLFLSCLVANAQSPYQLDKTKEWLYIGTGVGTLTIAGLLHHNVPPLSSFQVKELDVQGIWSIDRWATKNNSKVAASWSDVFMYGSTLLPLGAYFAMEEKKEIGKVGLMMFETISITYGLTHVVKNVFPRNRPFTYNPDADYVLKQTQHARKSFFSGHTSYAAASSFFAASVISKYSDNQTVKTLSWIGAATIPAVSGMLRIKAGKHFLTDVLTGYAVGATIGYLIPRWHEKERENSIGLLPYYGGESSGLVMTIPLWNQKSLGY